MPGRLLPADTPQAKQRGKSLYAVSMSSFLKKLERSP